MKKILLLYFSCFIFVALKASSTAPIFANDTIFTTPQDTIIEDEIAKEDKLIDEVVKSRRVPKKEKVQYFNQLTKYGFKNLFSNLSYNTTVPYIAQINPNAEVFVQDYMRVHGSYLQKMKGWGLPYFNLIESVLKQYGLPKELKYIAVIESNLSTGATSSVGAGGPWQFMPYTARDFGLVVNASVDERRDYFKSTHAAARYLLSLYKQMNDWLLVMAAYNGGPGRVYSAIKKSGSKNFWNLQYYLPAESRTYVKRFIATHYIMEGTGGVTTIGDTHLDPNEFAGLENTNTTNYGGSSNHQNPHIKKINLSENELVDVEVLSISGKYNSLIIAKTLMMDIGLFNHYNPNFESEMSSTGNFDLRLPPEKMQLFVVNKYPILNESIQLLLSGVVLPTNKMIYPKIKEKRKGK